MNAGQKRCPAKAICRYNACHAIHHKLLNYCAIFIDEILNVLIRLKGENIAVPVGVGDGLVSYEPYEPESSSVVTSENKQIQIKKRPKPEASCYVLKGCIHAAYCLLMCNESRGVAWVLGSELLNLANGRVFKMCVLSRDQKLARVWR